tara:strand:+ start:238 stop:1533 length:1296 start_codon:yes stop_codon:yes gene_type:complete
MAIIPSNTQFIGDTTGIPIQELRSAQINALSGAFTMQDIIDTVGTDTNTTYDLSSVQTGADVNVNLTGSDATTDTVKFVAGPNITLTNSGSNVTIEAAGGGGGGGLAGTQYVYVAADGPDTANGAELQAAYSTAQTMSPSQANPVTIIAAPGTYNLSSNFIMNTPYINLVSLDGNRSIAFNGLGLNIPSFTSNIYVKGVDVLYDQFIVGDFNDDVIIENCKCLSSGCFGASGQNVSTYIDCEASNGSFSSGGLAGGTYINCVGGHESFGGYGTASGTFTNCVGGNLSFGGYGTASGVFTNCVGEYQSFGSTNQASGEFINCKSFDDSFGGGGNASGIFINCESTGNGCFGAFGQASGTFTNCIGTAESFGAFGGATGVYNSCIGGNLSFGGNGNLSGQAYYCRLTTGTFQTVSGAGRTVLCIDGNNNQNNQ